MEQYSSPHPRLTAVLTQTGCTLDYNPFVGVYTLLNTYGDAVLTVYREDFEDAPESTVDRLIEYAELTR